jgi:hypothetical protein
LKIAQRTWLIFWVGVYLIDLVYIEGKDNSIHTFGYHILSLIQPDGNPDKIDGLVNVAKLSLVSSIIREVQQYQLKKYTCQRHEGLLGLLDRISTVQTENYLYELSLKQEPRGSPAK